MLGAPQAKILWSAPSKSRFYYLFLLLELMPGHLRRSILRILVLNPTHEISWSRSGFFSLRGRILRAGPPAPLCFLVFVFSPPPSALEAPGRPLNERSKTLRPGPQAEVMAPWPRAANVVAVAVASPCGEHHGAARGPKTSKNGHGGASERFRRDSRPLRKSRGVGPVSQGFLGPFFGSVRPWPAKKIGRPGPSRPERGCARGAFEFVTNFMTM